MEHKSLTKGHTYKKAAPETPFTVVKALEIFVAVYFSGPASATASILARYLRMRPNSVSSAPVDLASCCIVLGVSLFTKVSKILRSTAVRIAMVSKGCFEPLS